MTDPRQDRATGLSAPWAGAPARGRRDFSGAIASVFFCVGVMLLPALAALDLSVALACPGLGPIACIALFQPPAR